MDDLTSPYASSGTASSSFSGDSYSISSDEDHSVTDLTYHFDQHTLRTPWHVDYLEPPPSDPSDRHSSRTFQATSPPHDCMRLVRQQRQSTSRRQCSPAHLLRVSMIVEDMLRDDTSCCTTSDSFSHGNSHSPGASRQSSRGFEGPASNTLDQIDSNPSNPTCSISASGGSSFEYGELDPVRCSKPQHLYKVGKEPRHIHLCQGVKRKPAIEKDIRLRRRMAD